MGRKEILAKFRASMPLAIDRMYEIALNPKGGKVLRRRALKDLLARGFARPSSTAEDPNFNPSPMTLETRTQLKAELAALK